MRGFKHTVSPCFSAINIKTIGVTFNNEPTAEQKAALSFAVKNSAGTAVATEVNWDGKTAKIARTNNIDYMVGTYAVEVAGLAEAYSANVQIAARTATNLEIGAEQLPDATAAAPLNVTLKDQYGEAMPLVQGDFTATLYNETQGQVLSTQIGFASNKFHVNTEKLQPADTVNTDMFKLNDQVKITFVHNATGLSVTKTIPVVAGAQVAEITIGEVILPTGATQLTQNLTGVRIPVAAKDQYGNPVTLAKNGNVTLFSSDQTKITNAALTIQTVDNKQYIDIASFAAKGNVTVQLLGIGSGVTASKALTILDAPGSIATITPAESQITVAKGSKAYIALDVKDLYGTTITPANYVGQITLTSTNNTVVDIGPAATQAKIIGTSSDTNYGKLEIPVLVGATDGASTTITLLVAGVQKATVTVTAGATAVPSSIEIKATPVPETTLLVNGTTKISYTVRDQYGAVMANIGDYKITYETTSGGATIISGYTGDVTGDVSGTKTEKTITGVKQGTDGLKVSLKKADNTVVASVTTTFTVRQLAGLTYAIDDIATLYNDAKTISTNEANAVKYGYAKEIVVRGNDGSRVPYESIVSVESNRDADGVKIYEDLTAKKYYVLTDQFTNFGTPAADQKAIITALVNANDDLFTVTKEVTISKDPLQVTSVEFKNLAPEVASLTNSALADVSTKSLSKKADWDNTKEIFDASDAANSAYVWVRDQFGGFGLSYAAMTLAVAEVSGVNTISGDTVTLSSPQDGKLTRNNVTNAVFTANNAKFRIVASTSGKSDYITVTMADGVLPAAAASGAVTVTQATPSNYAAGDKITIKFSEPVDATKVIIANMTISASHTLGTGATVAPTTGVADTFTITLGTGTDVVAGDTIKITATNVVDAAGNVAAADVEFTLP